MPPAYHYRPLWTSPPGTYALDVTAYGVTPGSVCSAALQALCDANPGAALYFPPGEYLTNWPVSTGTCKLVGSGPRLTHEFDASATVVRSALRGMPVFVVGFGEAQYGKGPDGTSNDTTPHRIQARHRPELGNLSTDGSLNWPALDTQGELVGVAVTNAASYGVRFEDNYDSFGSIPEFTVEFLWDGDPEPGQGLFGFYEHDPYGCYIDGEGRFNFAVCTVDPSDPYGPVLGHNLVSNTIPRGDVRVRCSFETGEFSLWDANGQVPGSAAIGPPIKGRRLNLNRFDRPFMLGEMKLQLPMGSKIRPPLRFGGFRFSVGLRDDPPSGLQADRYTGLRAEGVAWYLDLSKTGSRWIGVQGGPATDASTGVMGLVSTQLDLNGQIGGSISNMSVEGGSPCVLIGQACNLTFKNLSLVNGDSGLGCMRFGVLYPVDLDEVALGGRVSAASLSGASVRCHKGRITVWGGPVGLALCSTSWENSSTLWVERASKRPECVVAMERGNDGNVFTGPMLVDNEDGNPILRAAVYCERGGYGFSRVLLSNVTAAHYAPGSAVVELRDLGGELDQYAEAVCVVESCSIPRGGSPAAARVVGDHWDVHLRSCPSDATASVKGRSTVRFPGA